VANFLNYLNNGSYTSGLIHRSVPGFVIQGGGFVVPGTTVTPVTTLAPIKNEARYSNTRGTVAMAKLGGDPDSATSQWFVNLADNSANLDNQNGGFTVFALVVQGMDVIDKIAALTVYDASTPLKNGALTQLPMTSSSLVRSSLVLINRAYTTDLLPGTTAAPYHCSTPLINETLTEVCSGAVTFPVMVEGLGMYEATIQVISDTPNYVLQLTGAKPLTTTPALYATYSQATRLLQIPSVRVGITAYVNVTLQLTRDAPMQFTLQNLTPR
jgi:peptidyl-prolyl cis-trans isomerase A (cyclophilin A)